MSNNIINGNIFLTGDGFGRPPLLFSTFQRAERNILGRIRELASYGNPCGGLDDISIIQCDTNITKRIDYSYRIERHKKNYIKISVKRRTDGGDFILSLKEVFKLNL